MGRIADILQARGDIEEALRIRKDGELPVYEQIGDIVGITSSHWGIGRIQRQQGLTQDALESFFKSYHQLLALNHLAGIVRVGIDLGQLLYAVGRSEEGHVILTRSYEGYLTLGNTDAAASLQTLIDKLQKENS